MLNCICGMVEKTQSAISILQQRQADVVNIRATEELVAEVQTKASIAIMEVKQDKQKPRITRKWTINKRILKKR